MSCVLEHKNAEGISTHDATDDFIPTRFYP